MDDYINKLKDVQKKAKRHRFYFFSFALALLLSCYSGVFATVSANSSTNAYVDPKLGFSLQIPNTWKAHTYPGSNSNATTSGVMFSISSSLQDQIGISVIRDKSNPQSFAQRGKPALHIGSYPAFTYDTPKQKQYPLACLIRVMLSGNDLVTATWCSPHPTSQAQHFDSILATYQSQSTVKPSPIRANTVNPVESCQDVINENNAAYQGGDWGIQQGNPTDSQWTATFNPGAAVCDNFITGSNPSGGYLFQCVELANRFAREQWGIAPGFTVNAAQYFDYYQNGTFYQGQARTLYGDNVQLSSDASQGTSNLAPVPGDLLVWQSVNDPTQGWTSGLTSGPGHVAVITNVDSSHVYIAQQNYSEPQYYATLSLTKVANGWTISGLPFYDSGIITRGWIHFNANPHSANPPPPPTPKDQIKIGGNTLTTRGDVAMTDATINGTESVYLAYTGIDALNHINIVKSSTGNLNDFGSQVVTTERSSGLKGPSLCTFNNRLYIAWASTETPSRINIGWFNGTSTIQDKVVLPNELTSSRPSIAGYNGQLYVSWRGTEGSINIASSSDGINFSSATTFTTDKVGVDDVGVETAPVIANMKLAGATVPYLFLAWKGSTNDNMTVAYYDATHPSNTLRGHVVLTDQTLHSPALQSFGGYLWLGWTGEDSGRSLQAAGSTTGADTTFNYGRGTPGGIVTVAHGPSFANYKGHLYIAVGNSDTTISYAEVV